MLSELQNLEQTQTWSLIHPSPNFTVIGFKWVYAIKRNSNDSVMRYKSRLVALRNHQIEGLDFTEAYSPVVKPATIRMFLTLALSMNWLINQYNFNNAFLNGKLQEVVYMKQPPDFDNGNSNAVCKLHKAIYGLKQAPCVWYITLSVALGKFGFTRTRSDPFLFTKRTSSSMIFILVYVDNILVIGNNQNEITALMQKLHGMFALKSIGTFNYFLEIEATKLKSGAYYLSQTKYIKDVLHKSSMINTKSVPTPMITSEKSLNMVLNIILILLTIFL